MIGLTDLSLFIDLVALPDLFHTQGAEKKCAVRHSFSGMHRVQRLDG